MKRTVISFLIITLIFAFAGCGKVEPTVFTIDGTEVSMKEYNIYYNQYMLQAKQSIPEDQLDEYWNTEVDGKTNYQSAKDAAYNQLMENYVIAKYAQKSGFTFSDEVLQMASTVKNQFTGGSYQSFYEELDTDSTALDNIAKNIAISEAMYAKLMDDGVIDLSETAKIKNFEENYYKAQHILVMTTDDAGQPVANKEEKKAYAEGILQRVNNGEDFTTLANELSEDPGQESNPDGYVFTEGEMVKEFEDSVKSLEFGAVSGLVETSYGYHIIKRLPLSYENDVAKVENFEQKIISSLISKYVEQNIENWKKELNIVENKNVIDNLKR